MDYPDSFLLEEVARMLVNKIKHSIKGQRNPENAEFWRKCLKAVVRAKRMAAFKEYKEEVEKDLQSLNRIIGVRNVDGSGPVDG